MGSFQLSGECFAKIPAPRTRKPTLTIQWPERAAAKAARRCKTTIAGCEHRFATTTRPKSEKKNSSCVAGRTRARRLCDEELRPHGEPDRFRAKHDVMPRNRSGDRSRRRLRFARRQGKRIRRALGPFIPRRLRDRQSDGEGFRHAERERSASSPRQPPRLEAMWICDHRRNGPYRRICACGSFNLTGSTMMSEA